MIGNIQLVHSMVQMVVHVKKGGEVMNKNKFVSVMKLHGDTQVNFNGDESDSDKVDILLNYLLNSGKGELVCYRKIRW